MQYPQITAFSYIRRMQLLDKEGSMTFQNDFYFIGEFEIVIYSKHQY